MRWLLVLALACSSTARPSREAAPASPTVTETADEFVTVAELWAPDESAVLGVVIAMREAPRGNAHDFEMPTGDHDPGDGFGVLFGARLIREDGEVISATTEREPRTFELSRRALPAPVQVWTFDDANVRTIDRLEPCESCEPWRSPPTRFVVVVAEGQPLRATPDVGWSIAISP